ncbi:MAG: glycoside hydrolase family 27 protein [Bryobacteraceae bacterium]
MRRYWSALAFVAGLALMHVAHAGQADIARTPVMGWSSWNYYTCKVNDAIVRASADALIENGMAAAGYQYVIVDDCWAGERDAGGALRSNSKFPDMKALSDYLHGKGLKFGIYSSPGPKTCAGYEGSLGHEEQDAALFGRWGIDWLKYDLCTFQGDAPAQVAAFRKMHDGLVKTGRDIVFALCQYGNNQVWTWGESVGGNQWRTSRDITDNYDRMAMNGFGENGLEQFAGPGHWNDPDMLEVGNGKMSRDEYLTHMSLWCLLAAPLLAGTDVIHIKPETLEILTNREAIAVDQDALGIQGRRVSQEGPLEVWMKPLKDGSKAVGLFNRGESPMPVTALFRDLGIVGAAEVRNLWEKRDLGISREKFTATVPVHGVVMVRMQPLAAKGQR